MNHYIDMGVLLIVAGLTLEKVQEKRKVLLAEVARDNMALRFYIHNREVQKNA